MSAMDDAVAAPGRPGDLGSLLRWHRRRALISQERLAELSNVSVRTIRAFESGRVRSPRSESVRLLAAALDLDAVARRQFENAAGGPGRPPTPDHPPAELPAVVTDFTGRDEVSARIRGVVNCRDTMATVIVTGRPGVGKSALAVHVAHQVRHAFPDGQLYVRLRGGEGQPLPPGQVLARLLRVLGVVGSQIPDSVADSTAMLRSRLAGRAMLLVLDDAASEWQVRPLLPGAATCAVIVTSRYRLSGLEGTVVEELDVLQPEHALTLLGRVAGHERVSAELEQAEEIVRLCGRIPLALRIAGARLIARPHWTLARLAGLLADEHRRLDELSVADLEVRAGIALSYQELGTLAQAAFRLLGLLGAADVSPWLAGALLELGSDEAERVLDELVDARLLDIDRRPSVDSVRYRFHDLVRLYAREQADADLDEETSRAALQRALGAWLAVAEQADARLPDTSDVITRGNAPRYALPPEVTDRLVEDPLAWFEAERANLVLAVELACRLGVGDLAWELAGGLISWAILRSQWDLWRHTHELALATSRAVGDRRGEAAMLAGLGRLQCDQRRGAVGLPEFATALTIFRALGDRHAEARLLVVQALALQMAGRTREGLESAVAGVRFARAVGASDTEADGLFVMAQGHLDLGEHTQAEAAARDAAARYEALGARRGYAQALWQLASLRRLDGDFETAALLLRRCLATVEDIGDRRGQARVLLDLGTLALERDDAEMAADTFAACVRTCEEIGEKHFLAQAVAALAAIGSDVRG